MYTTISILCRFLTIFFFSCNCIIWLWVPLKLYSRLRSTDVFTFTNSEMNYTLNYAPWTLLIALLHDSQNSRMKMIHLIKVVSGNLLTSETITKTSTNQCLCYCFSCRLPLTTFIQWFILLNYFDYQVVQCIVHFAICKYKQISWPKPTI